MRADITRSRRQQQDESLPPAADFLHRHDYFYYLEVAVLFRCQLKGKIIFCFLQTHCYIFSQCILHSSVLHLCSDTHKPQSIILVYISSETRAECGKEIKVNWYFLICRVFVKQLSELSESSTSRDRPRSG